MMAESAEVLEFVVQCDLCNRAETDPIAQKMIARKVEPLRQEVLQWCDPEGASKGVLQGPAGDTEAGAEFRNREAMLLSSLDKAQGGQHEIIARDLMDRRLRLGVHGLSNEPQEMPSQSFEQRRGPERVLVIEGWVDGRRELQLRP